MRPAIALMIYGVPGSDRNVFKEEKYKKLAAYLIEQGFIVDSVLYHDSISNQLEKELLKYQAILVWVNPIEQGNDRKVLDALLENLSLQGCFVSAHPHTILKMGTKEILYLTRTAEFGSDVKLYRSFSEFKQRFLQEGEQPKIRILKQYRGNGGNGVFKVDATLVNDDAIIVTHATNGDREEQVTIAEFFNSFEVYFNKDGRLIDQVWNPNIINGMVRCYLSGIKVAGFGYQEINALYPVINGVYKKPSQRFYFSEDCKMFQDLKTIMETSWISRLQDATGIKTEMLPVIWDADFFINKINSDNPNEKYTLCEINVSSVSPFPESAIVHIANNLRQRVAK